MIPIYVLTGKRFRVTGEDSLMRRPLTIYEELFTQDDHVFSLENGLLTVDAKLSPAT